jgi:hypothetical protein
LRYATSSAAAARYSAVYHHARERKRCALTCRYAAEQSFAKHAQHILQQRPSAMSRRPATMFIQARRKAKKCTLPVMVNGTANRDRDYYRVESIFDAFSPPRAAPRHERRRWMLPRLHQRRRIPCELRSRFLR